MKPGSDLLDAFSTDVGTTRVYHYSFDYDTADGNTSGTYTETITAVQQTEEGWIYKGISVYSGDLAVNGIADESSSLYSINGNHLTILQIAEQIDVHWPMVIGNSWDHTLSLEQTKWQVVAVDNVKSPAGEFSDCYLLEDRIEDSTQLHLHSVWFCPKVGVVSAMDMLKWTSGYGSYSHVWELQIFIHQ